MDPRLFDLYGVPPPARDALGPEAARARRAIDRPALASQTTDLTELFADHRVLSWGFSAIAVSAADQVAAQAAVARLSVNRPASAWYGLMRVSTDDVGQEFSWHGYRAVLRSALFNAASLAFTQPMRWGDTRGLGAAVVIGLNLPIRTLGWTFDAALDSPLILPQVSGPRVTELTGPHRRTILPFPPGDYAGATVLERTDQSLTSPLVMRVVQGATLDVALVLPAQTIVDNFNEGINDVIYGYAAGECLIGLIRNPSTFTP